MHGMNYTVPDYIYFKKAWDNINQSNLRDLNKRNSRMTKEVWKMAKINDKVEIPPPNPTNNNVKIVCQKMKKTANLMFDLLRNEIRVNRLCN